MKKCDHYWSYVHAVWDGRKPNEIAVGRYCSKCGKQQCAYASDWRVVPASYKDMREELKSQCSKR